MSSTSGRLAILRQLKAGGIVCLFGNLRTLGQNLVDGLQDSEFTELLDGP
ncbi:hypothetical protein [Teichococcus aerofrigidensis]